MRLTGTLAPLTILCATCAMATLSPTRAQTGTWQQRTLPVTQPQQKSTQHPSNAVKSEEVSPSRMPSASLGGSGNTTASPSGRDVARALSAAGTLGPTSSPATGDNAAYEAFDQGRYLTALELATKAAEAGDAVSHTLIGRIHAEGFGVPQNRALAAKWYARGADLGDIEAAFALGVLHAQGSGVEKSLDLAARYFETAAAKGHPLANYNLALLFLKGEGKPHNPHRGFAHMRYAAEQGIIVAQYDLGTLHAEGVGTDANAFEAALWIGKAATRGHLEAQIDYAVILLKDHDVPPDQKAALRKQGFDLLASAAERGSSVAQNRLAKCYANGIGVERSATEAAKWHLIAKAGGIDDESLDAIERKLSRSDREKVRKAASEWQERAAVQ